MAEKVNIKAIFAANLIRLRKEAGLSQKRLSEIAGLTHNFINDIENEKKGISVMTLGRLSEALQTDPALFFLDPARWYAKADPYYLLLLDTLNENTNRLFDKYRKLINRGRGDEHKLKKDT